MYMAEREGYRNRKVLLHLLEKQSSLFFFTALRRTLGLHQLKLLPEEPDQSIRQIKIPAFRLVF